MKKLLCALLALVMLCACAVAETVDVMGTWYLAEVCYDGVSTNPAQLGMETTLTFQADGTVDMDAQWEFLDRMSEVYGEQETDLIEEEPSAEAHWEMDGDKVVLSYEDKTVELTLVDGNLVRTLSKGDSEGDGMQELDSMEVYSREKPAANYFDPGTPLTDVTVEDFDGTWNVAIVNFAGMELTAEEMGLEMTVELSGGSGTITDSSYGIDEPITYAVTGEIVDGMLTVTEVEPADEASIMTFTLYDSGVMAYSEGDLGMIYFERTEAAAGAEE